MAAWNGGFGMSVKMGSVSTVEVVENGGRHV
jgi:hypothetical protein